MDIRLHPQLKVQALEIGSEKAPLLVIDNLVADPEALVSAAAASEFGDGGKFYPGIRAATPAVYPQFFLHKFGRELIRHFKLRGTRLSLGLCHFSMVTTPASELSPWQRVPHIDGVSGNGLAAIHYLFKKDLGGTAFYRHRQTGFEVISEARAPDYFRALEEQTGSPKFPAHGFINGTTALFDQVQSCDGVFNRMLIYRKNSLHSGSIDPSFEPSTDPRAGRLSINCFIDSN